MKEGVEQGEQERGLFGRRRMSNARRRDAYTMPQSAAVAGRGEIIKRLPLLIRFALCCVLLTSFGIGQAADGLAAAVSQTSVGAL